MNRHLITALLLMPLCSPPASQATELGRLFYTPQDRQQLEYQQARNSVASSGTSSGGGSVIIVNGIVQKHGGKRTVWINGVAQTVERSNDRMPETVPVNVPGESQPIQLKVGQRHQVSAPSTKSNAEEDD